MMPELLNLWRNQPILDIISNLVPDEMKSQDGKTDRVLASMGIYVFNAAAMFDALQGNAKDFGKEIIPSLVKTKIFGVIYLMIIGKILAR